MKPLSPSTRDAIQTLWRVWTDADRESRHLILNRLHDVDEPAAIPGLAPLLFSQTETEARTAAAIIHRIAARCSPLILSELDPMVRRLSWYGLAGQKSDPLSVGRGLAGALGILSFNEDGRVRETAVRALDVTPDALALPFLLIRLNDWVAPVRRAAEQGVENRLVPECVPAFVASLPLVFQLQRRGRGDNQRMSAEIYEFLLRPEHRDGLAQGLTSTDRATRHSVFRLLSHVEGDGPTDSMRSAASSTDPVLRFFAARELRNRLSGDPLIAALSAFASDRFMPVRREALYGFVQKAPALALEQLRSALLDTHPSIRDLARSHLGKDFNFADFYRRQLENGSSRPAVAIAGLGETGLSDDGRLILPYLAHPDPRVRRATLRAASRLVPHECEKILVTALADRSARVCNAARDILLKLRFHIDPLQLWAVFQSTETRHGWRASLRLINEHRWWVSAPLLLRAAVLSSDPERRAVAVRYLESGSHNRGRLSARPTTAQKADLRDAVEAAVGIVPDQVLVDALWHLERAP